VVVLVLASCASADSPGESAEPSAPASQPASGAPSQAPSGAEREAIEDAATREVRLEGGPDWPTELDGSLWILAPDGPLGTGGTAPLIYRVDPETGEEQAQVTLPGRFCQGMTAAFDALWACFDEGLARIDPAANSIAVAIAYQAPQVYSRPAVGPDAIWALSGQITADSVVRIDPATNVVTATYPLGQAATSLAYGFDALWATATTQGTLLRIDPATGEVTEHATDLPSPFIMSVGLDSLWVLLYGDRQADGPGPDDPVVARIDPGSGEATLLGPAGRAPHEGDILATGDGVWVRGQDPMVARINPATGDVDRVVTGSFAGGTLGLGFGSLWTTATEFGRVWGLEP
jgi:streptogramin lyase